MVKESCDERKRGETIANFAQYPEIERDAVVYFGLRWRRPRAEEKIMEEARPCSKCI
jgi:hypothetical protein